MKCNRAKFQVLRYGHNQDLKDNTVYFTKEMEGIIEQHSKLRDLGVILSDDAKFVTLTKLYSKLDRKLAGCSERSTLEK